MGKHRAIPPGYMTVGEVAKKMGITVRTLQYYDRVTLVCPSAESEGGRRLYNDRDIFKLHQILSLKSLGFSLNDIKKRLISLDNPADVAETLSKQAADIQRKINALSESLTEIEMLRTEVLQMQTVNFKKYADIIVNLQMKNEYYYLIKRFDDKMLDHIRNRFDKESGLEFMKKFNCINEEIMALQKIDAPPGSEQSQSLAEKFWDLIMEFTNGDMSMLPDLMEVGNAEGMDREWDQRQKIVNHFMEQALDIYFTRLGVNPFQEEKE